MTIPTRVGSEVGNVGYMPMHQWRSSNDIVNGWDFSIPPTFTVEPRSGLFMIANAPPPPEYVGNRLYLYNARWRDLEPRRDDYSGIDDLVRDLEAIDANPSFDGVMLQARGIVVDYSTTQSPPTSPTWLTSPVVVEEPGPGGGRRHEPGYVERLYR